MLNVIYAECNIPALYAECRFAECRYAECHYAQCRYAECHYAVSRGDAIQAGKNILKISYELIRSV